MRTSLIIVLGCVVLTACGDDESSGSFASDATANATWWGAADTGRSSTWSATDAGQTGSADTAIASWDTSGPTAPPEDDGNTNIAFGGAQDFGYPRKLIADGQVPRPEVLEAAGFFAEHATPLPQPVCGNRICIQAMLGVMGNLASGQACTMLQLGMNSPIVVDPSDRPPLTLAVVVDVSGSMSADDRIGYVREGLKKMVSELYDDDRIAIITFSTGVDTLVPMTEIRGHRNDLMAAIDDLAADGSTNIHDGLREGYEAIQDAWQGGRQNRVILLSDGQATTGVTDTTIIMSMSRAYNSDGIGLTTVGLGTDFNLALMQGLAQQADGNFYFLESPTAVDEVFTEELAYFTLPVAFDVTLDVRTGQDYEVVRASGSDKFVLDGGGGTLTAPSVFFAHRMAHDDVHEGENGEVGRRGGGSALVLEMMPRDLGTGAVHGETGFVADVSLSYRDPESNTIVSDTVRVTYPYAPSEILETGFFDNLIVTKTFVMLNLFAAIESACELFHSGHALEGLNVLLRVIAAARDYEDSANGGEGDVDIRLDIELMEDLADVIADRGGLNDPPPPTIPENPWPND